MPRAVRLHRRFVDDTRRHTAWLSANGHDDWTDGLLVGIEEVAGRLARFPMVGPLVQEDERVVLRKLIFRHLPYVAWYAYAKPVGDVWLLRLFGAHQDRADPDSASWSGVSKRKRVRSGR